jgi:hypothetical protein
MPNEKILTPAGEMYVPNLNLPKAIVVDVDGTVAKMKGRSPYEWNRVGEDAPVADVIEIISALRRSGVKLVFLSGRDGSCRLETQAWFDKFIPVPYDGFYMRPAGNNEKDSVVKLRLFDSHIRDFYNVISVFDDRDQVVEMWRSIGLTVMQVEYGAF